jgi:hypothetical protein
MARDYKQGEKESQSSVAFTDFEATLGASSSSPVI